MCFSELDKLRQCYQDRFTSMCGETGGATIGNFIRRVFKDPVYLPGYSYKPDCYLHIPGLSPPPLPFTAPPSPSVYHSTSSQGQGSAMRTLGAEASVSLCQPVSASVGIVWIFNGLTLYILSQWSVGYIPQSFTCQPLSASVDFCRLVSASCKNVWIFYSDHRVPQKVSILYESIV